MPSRRRTATLALLVCCLGAGRARGSHEGKAVPFDPTAAPPYFASGPAAEAAAALRLEEYAKAADGFADYVKRHPGARDRLQASFLQAYAALKAGQLAPAAARFDALRADYPLLADYELLLAARAYLGLGRPAVALERARKLAEGSPLDAEARLVRGDAEGKLGHPAAAAAEYRGYLAAYPASWRAHETRGRLAEALDTDGDGAAATVEWRTVYLEAPQEPWGLKAATHLGPQPFTAAELARRAMALFDAMRNADAEAEWKKVLAAPGLTDALACQAAFHQAQSVFKARDRVRAAPLFDGAITACEKAKDEDLTVKSLYQGGRSWGTRGDKDAVATRKAIGLFDRVWREHAAHSYADDARLREAELCDSLKDDQKATELLSGLPAAFAGGDQRGEALWRLAFRAWRKGDLDGAQKALESELALLPREDGWWEAGRTLYWLGRVADRQGKGDDAAGLYARAVEEYPLSYYALQGLNRLREKWPDRLATLVANLSGAPAAREPAMLPASIAPRGHHAAAATAPDDAWRFAARPLYGTAAFRRAVELVRLGLGAEAKRELGLIGVEAPRKRSTVGGDDPAQEELLWLSAVLYDRAGEWALSHAVPRHLLTAWTRDWPRGANRKRWQLAYPRAYRDLIEKHAPLNGQPTALEFAVVREESAFDPLMESFANAVGLTQLTAAPAQRFANGLPHDRQALRDPAINVAIGARELGALWHSYAGNAALAIAGYNAGETPVNRWLRDPERAGLVLDEFIEAIPYDETRGYTKRVLSSFFAYQWLWESGDARIPVLPPALPKLGRR